MKRYRFLVEALVEYEDAIDTFGRYDDGRRVVDRALAIDVARLGPDHPGITSPLLNRGQAALAAGDAAAAAVDMSSATNSWATPSGLRPCAPRRRVGTTPALRGSISPADRGRCSSAR